MRDQGGFYRCSIEKTLDGTWVSSTVLLTAHHVRSSVTLKNARLILPDYDAANNCGKFLGGDQIEEAGPTPPGSLWRRHCVVSAFDRIDPLFGAFERAHPQAHLLSQLPADESPNAMGLPAGDVHDGLEAGSRRLAQ